nr:MAG TPA: hypothetical protein [Caudoviricetes sp.]
MRININTFFDFFTESLAFDTAFVNMPPFVM